LPPDVRFVEQNARNSISAGALDTVNKHKSSGGNKVIAGYDHWRSWSLV